jgi:hydroxymethylbilane synthase
LKILGITTEADEKLSLSLMTIGGKGLFVKELEQALLDGRADIAVHSVKDMPMELPTGLCLPVYCQREEARDAFISNQFKTISDLPEKAILGTSSLRRQSQMHAMMPDLIIANLRGNVNTRLAKLDAGEYMGIILAAAGLARLGLQNRINQLLSLDQCLPAAGQGVIGIECREEDEETRHIIAPLNHPETEICVRAERALCQSLNANCRVPVGAFAELVQAKLLLRAVVAKVDGSVVLKASGQDFIENLDSLAERVATNLVAQGADKILASIPTGGF